MFSMDIKELLDEFRVYIAGFLSGFFEYVVWDGEIQYNHHGAA